MKIVFNSAFNLKISFKTYFKPILANCLLILGDNGVCLVHAWWPVELEQLYLASSAPSLEEQELGGSTEPRSVWPVTPNLPWVAPRHDPAPPTLTAGGPSDWVFLSPAHGTEAASFTLAQQALGALLGSPEAPHLPLALPAFEVT